MKSYRKEVWVLVPTRCGFINMTPQINECLSESGITEGLALVNSMHTTASVFINDDEEGLIRDFEAWLERLATDKPKGELANGDVGKDYIGADNIDAHLKRQVMGREVVVAITQGRLDLGSWEQIFYGEFDGGRKKRLLVKIVGE